MINGFVYVVESPADTDILNGQSEGQVLCNALKLAQIPFSYSLVTTPKTFEMALKERLTDAIAYHGNLMPIIHFSSHGNEHGIGLSTGDFLSWDHLRDALRPINKKLEGNLLICMSSCNGGNGCVMAMHEQDDPDFWALVGNSGAALWSDAAVAFITFYHLFFKGRQIAECINAMKIASGDDRFLALFGKDVKADWIGALQKQKAEELAEALSSYGKSGRSLAEMFAPAPEQTFPETAFEKRNPRSRGLLDYAPDGGV